MWMQLGSRAFLAGANQRMYRHDDESKRSRSYLTGISHSHSSARRNSLSQVCHFGNRDAEAKQCGDCVYLTNPSMNELMETLSRNSSGDSNRLIVVGNAGNQKLLMTQLDSAEDRESSGRQSYRAFSADDVNHMNDSRQSLVLKIRSEGTLVPMPGIDSSLSTQMALLKPLYNEQYMESSMSLPNADLDAAGEFIFRSNDSLTYEQNEYLGVGSCKCSLCLSQSIDLTQGVDHQVDRAKKVVKEAVQEAAKGVDRRFSSPDPLKLVENESPSLNTTLYLVNLAHILMVIACLRGIF
ncbi:uncharacterized protein LOC111519311 [Drosophila willistoni]|uniref:uncharacterized protein LOC111519311 n=1 Tax=Drosophila willistoni TaxID=7260 RepID=UPI000C26D15A|nr:uncharacterized protein LOC111519311 [Drosophila willistoni]